MRRRLVMTMLALLVVTPVRGDDWMPQTYTMAPGDLDIPTTRWTGDGYARGSIAVLVFLVEPIHQHNSRQPMELARATGFDVEYVHMVDYKHQVDNDRARRLLDAKQWDVIMFWHRQDWGGSFGWPADDVKFRILKQVVGGAGLVLTDRGPNAVFRKDRRVPTPVVDLLGGLCLMGRASRDQTHWKNRYRNKKPAGEAALRKSFFETYQLGRGRGLLYKGKFTFGDHFSRLTFARPFSYDHRIDHQVAFAELSRVLLWAAGKEPVVSFTGEPEANASYTTNTVGRQLPKWTLSAPAQVKTLTVTSRVRDLAGRVAYRDKQQFDNAGQPIDYVFNVPKLGAGRYYADIFVDSPRGRETWGYWGFEVKPDATVTLAVDPSGHAPGAPVRGTVAVKPVDDQPMPGVVRLRLVDDLDRILDETTVKATAEPTAFSIDTDEHDSMQLRVVADALREAVSVGSTFTVFNQLKRRQNRFNVLLWGSFGGAYAHWGKRKLWQTGVTTSMAGGAAEGRMTATPFIAVGNAWTGTVEGKSFKFGHGATRPKVDPKTGILTMVPTCWNNDTLFDKMLSFQASHWQGGLRQPVYVYNMYDEGPHSGACLDPHCLEAYRGWLKQQYDGDLDRLNTEWQSDYTAWDQVTVLQKNDNTEAEARKRGLYARWSDRKHFLEVNFARRIIGEQARRARAVDPQARIGFEGSGRFGMDFDELFEHAGFWCPYDGVQTEIVRSLKPEGFIHSFWIGYNKQSKHLTARTWRMVINGAPSIWWWMLKGRTRFHGWLAPNMMPYPENQQFLDQCVLPLRRGLGDLLIDLDMPHDGIALYYSVAAAHAGEIGDSAQYNSVTGAHENMVKLIEDCGYQWVYTTRRRVLAGDLEKRKIRLLLLPYQQPLGQDEVEALSRFVRDGGTVVADLRPGVYSGHCRPLEHGPAETLFGIRRTGPGEPAKLDGKAVAHLAGHEVPIGLRNNRADGHVAAAGAVVGATVSGKPVFLVNRIGKGHAVLLNFHLTQYNGEREMGQGRAQREFFEALASAAGISRKLDCLADDGSMLPRTERVTWTRGGVTLHALYRDGGTPAEATVKLPRPGYVFGLRSGEHGKTDTVKIGTLVPGYLEFLAVYPYDPGRPVVTPSAKSIERGKVVRFTIKMTGVPADEAGPFSYETVLTDPQGRRVDIMPWSVQGAGGNAVTHCRFAHNDPVGRWTLTVKDVTTGRKTSASVTLE